MPMAIRFLVVDDASFIRDMVKKQLRERIPGCEVYDASDGHRAISQLKKQRVDVILSDWEMPGMSGEELLRWVRSEEAYQNTPFIMVTSRGDREHVMQAVQAGVSDYIGKPFTSDELLKKTIRQLARIGKSLRDTVKMASSGSDVGFGSIDVLTGGRGTAEPTPTASPISATPPNPRSSAAAAEAPAAEPKSEPPARPKAGRTRAQLRFPALTCGCVVRDVSLQALTGLIQRGDHLPGLFEQAVVDIEMDDGEVARVNGYLSSIAAGENKQDTNVVKVSVRFVDNDPRKFETLSKFIARSR